MLSSICEFLYLYSYSKLLGKEKGVLCMKMEGDGKIEKVGASGVSKSSLSVCAEGPPIWAGSSSHSGPWLLSWPGSHTQESHPRPRENLGERVPIPSKETGH